MSNEEKKFNWSALASQAASAGNLLRAFEYAESVFNTVSNAEILIGQYSESLKELSTSIEVLSKEKGEFLAEIGRSKEELLSQRTTMLAETEQAFSEKKKDLKAEVVKLADAAKQQESALGILKAKYVKENTEYNKLIAERKKELASVELKYSNFLNKLKSV